jgi:hypothetical protein
MWRSALIGLALTFAVPILAEAQDPMRPSLLERMEALTPACQAALAERDVPKAQGFSFALNQSLLQSGQCTLADFSRMEALTGYDMSGEADPLRASANSAPARPQNTSRSQTASEQILDDMLSPRDGSSPAPKDGTCREDQAADGTTSVVCGGRKTWTWRNGKRQ